jgi:iduronate 2-sulfatase
VDLTGDSSSRKSNCLGRITSVCTMRSLSKQLRLRATILFFMLTAAISSEPRLEQSNLLFIMFDDLRPELSIYGRDHMITPNFERLAARSVIFDNVHAQISVCNPSRDSMLTGLRPDTIGTYSFQSSFRPHLTLPSRLASVGYNTAAYGKIAHWETSEKTVWSHDHWNGAWYEYQQFEWNIMNSSTMPDKIKPEEEFRDYLFASKTIETLKVLNAKQEYFMLGVGFKLPHLAVHIPYKYYDMYKGRESGWKLTEEELRFPQTAPAISYRCCASADFQFMEQEGARRSAHKVPIGNINDAFTHKMHEELMIGYAAGVTFVDKQLGRILDAIDQLELWGNLTVVLTADHGMHNGEKGIWCVSVCIS